MNEIEKLSQHVACDMLNEQRAPGAAKRVRDALLNNGVSPDTVGVNRYGNVVVRRSFFYRHGGDSSKFASVISSALKKAGLKFEIVGDGEHWANFRGGASVAQSSHWWVEIKLIDETPAPEDAAPADASSAKPAEQSSSAPEAIPPAEEKKDGPFESKIDERKCPKCGHEMSMGAPHGPWPVQWECHNCGKIINEGKCEVCKKDGLTLDKDGVCHECWADKHANENKETGMRGLLNETMRVDELKTKTEPVKMGKTKGTVTTALPSTAPLSPAILKRLREVFAYMDTQRIQEDPDGADLYDIFYNGTTGWATRSDEEVAGQLSYFAQEGEDEATTANNLIAQYKDF